MEDREGFCQVCNHPSKLERKSANHILHLILTIVFAVLTSGFFAIGGLIWLFVWIGSSIRFGGWVCHQCGSSKVAKKAHAAA